jgi:flavodoxin
MRSVIVYYSYSGNTRKVAHLLSEELKQKGGVEIKELRPADESRNFFLQCRRAIKHVRAKLEPADFDLGAYDLICIGTPVWAFGPAPAVNTWLAECRGIHGKNIVLFTTYGSGTGNKRCLDYMQSLLAAKGAKDFKRFSIQQFKIKNKELILSKIKEALE